MMLFEASPRNAEENCFSYNPGHAQPEYIYIIYIHRYSIYIYIYINIYIYIFKKLLAKSMIERCRSLS